jgi:hypothetical protein
VRGEARKPSRTHQHNQQCKKQRKQRPEMCTRRVTNEDSDSQRAESENQTRGPKARKRETKGERQRERIATKERYVCGTKTREKPLQHGSNTDVWIMSARTRKRETSSYCHTGREDGTDTEGRQHLNSVTNRRGTHLRPTGFDTVRGWAGGHDDEDERNGS